MNIQKYEKFFSESPYGNFMQSICWADLKYNWINEYITVTDESGNIIGAMMLLIKKIPVLHTSIMYAPRGPVCDMHNMEVLRGIFKQVKVLQKKYHSFIFRIDPLIDESDTKSIENLCSLGFEYHNERVGYDNTQCRENYVIDIDNRTSEEIFNGFKSKWRYNIRLAQRKGVKCDFYGEEKLDDFYALLKQTSERDGFNIRSKEYFARMLRVFDGKAKLCMCYINSIPLSGALMINYSGTTSYVYGCSSNEHRNYMPNYLMQWTMIKQAVETGCKSYDFCGIPYWYDETHKNYGVYKFKQGFNGHIQTWAGEFDYIFRKDVYKCARLYMRVKKHS